ncbi:MAG: right-handed parallel beta-helix repeat-containing protein [Nevskia sp.]|nr:right-handed parallel beta-helix repeat-containing protein [Nevskia sp.]
MVLNPFAKYCAIVAALLLTASISTGAEPKAGDVEWMRQPHPAPAIDAANTRNPTLTSQPVFPAELERLRQPHPAPAINAVNARNPAPTSLPAFAAELERLRYPHPALPINPPLALSVRVPTVDWPDSVDDLSETDQSDGSDQDTPTIDDTASADGAPPPYIVTAISSDGLILKTPVLPDLSLYNAQAARAKIVAKPVGRVGIGSMLAELSFKSFRGRAGGLREWAARQSSLPKVIFITGGYVTLHDLVRTLPKSAFEEAAKGEFIARLPINIRPGATLHIDNDVKVLRLSVDRGAFIVNEGQLFLTGTALEAWNEAEQKPAVFRDKHEFRPFLLSWGGSQTYIVASRVAHLGYAATKSYGVSISQFSPSVVRLTHRAAPTGWILDSEFYDNWYGFYCYEAEDVVIRNNIYRDNIKYGIDPHDRSRRLIIAENSAFRTKERHGIIVSREVNDSWIFDNKSYENGLSGIVIDRSSTNNIVARNQVYRNHSDGITIYESPDTLIWQNVSSGNGRHGMRVRNSTGVRLYDNIAIGNVLSGVYGHVKDLSDTDRNLRLDPFHQKVSMVIVGGQLVSNGSGPVSIDQPLSLELYDVDLRAPQRSLGIKFSGVLNVYQNKVLDILLRQRLPVVIKPATLTTSTNN